MKVDIDKEIYNKLEKRVKASDEFKDVDEYVGYILKQVVEKFEGKRKPAQTSEDEEIVKERLKSLGYLD